jgi:hypothetical protein
MKLFKQLFNFGADEVQQTERRLQSRYAVGPEFPITAAVAGNGWNGAGRVQNLAVGGLGLALDRGPAVDTGSTVRLGLRLEGYEILIGGQLRHVRPRTSGGFTCGVSLTFEDPAARHEYLQLLIPVSIGCSLAPIDNARVRQDEPGITKAVYAGESASRLTVWSRAEGAKPGPFSFEFSVGEHLVRGREGTPGVQTFSRVDDQRPHRVTDFAAHAGDALDGELKQLFRWAALNFRSTVPAPERKFLLTFAG